MKQAIKTLARQAALRLGTIIGSIAVGYGASAETAQAIELVMIFLVGLGADAVNQAMWGEE